MKLKTLIKLSLIFTAIFSSATAFAISDDDYGFQMHVQIGNQTGNDCKLTSQEIIHGVLIESVIPDLIFKDDSFSFDMIQQKLYGPEITLNYACNDNNIKFKVQQDFSLLQGHEPYVDVIESETSGLKLAVLDSMSSSLRNGRGIITIVIQKRK